MEFERVSRLSVPEEIIENVKEKIVSGELKPGDQLPSETRLAEMFDVGRSTVREAIKVMLSQGLIERNRNRNAYISETAHEKTIFSSVLEGLGSHRDAFEITEVRKILEPEAAALAAERQDSVLIDKLEKEYNSMVRNKSDHDAYIHHDILYHRYIFLGTGNRIIIELMDAINMGFKIERSSIIYGGSAIIEKLLKSHKQILEAIKYGNSKLARKKMLEHILDIEKELSRIYKN